MVKDNFQSRILFNSAIMKITMVRKKCKWGRTTLVLNRKQISCNNQLWGEKPERL